MISSFRHSGASACARSIASIDPAKSGEVRCPAERLTAIVAFGTDMDVYYAMPLGIFAGALAVFFVSVSEGQAVLQSAYQANSKVVSTVNQMAQTTTNLIQG